MASSADRLPPDLIRLLAERGDVRQVARGGIVIRERDVSESLFVLLSGRLKVFTRDERGREVIYDMLEAGEMFGEMFLDGGPRSASVKAITQAECLEVRGSEIRDFMRRYPGFSESLVIRLIKRLRHSTGQVRSLAFDSVFVRTVAAIDGLALSDHGQRFLPGDVSQQQVAGRIGATREMVNHVFRDLVRGGFLVRDARRGFVIPGPLPRHW
jgi:CRP/FNR family cyclic AMP-dependent transcriptional regulator